MFMKLIVHLRTSSSKFENASSRKKEYIFLSDIYCFVKYSSCLHLTFVAFCLLSVISNQ